MIINGFSTIFNDFCFLENRVIGLGTLWIIESGKFLSEFFFTEKKLDWVAVGWNEVVIVFEKWSSISKKSSPMERSGTFGQLKFAMQKTSNFIVVKALPKMKVVDWDFDRTKPVGFFAG